MARKIRRDWNIIVVGCSDMMPRYRKILNNKHLSHKQNIMIILRNVLINLN